MKRGSIVALIKEPLASDFELAKERGIDLPNSREVYTLSVDPYITSWAGIDTTAIKLEEKGDIEFNITYFKEVQSPGKGNNIVNSLTQDLCKEVAL